MTETAASSLVILLHGLSRSYRSMRRLEEQIAIAGYRTLNWDYPGRRHSLPALVEKFRDVLNGLDERDRADGQTVHFVTHSLGGLNILTDGSRVGANLSLWKNNSELHG